MSDPLLRRIERRAWLLTGLFALVALAIPGGGWRAAIGVLGGAVLSGVSYWAIARSVGRALERGARGEGRTRLRAVAQFIGRYALLAGLAYVMIARLRLHPVGLLGGASVIAAAVAVEAARHSSSET